MRRVMYHLARQYRAFGLSLLWDPTYNRNSFANGLQCNTVAEYEWHSCKLSSDGSNVSTLERIYLHKIIFIKIHCNVLQGGKRKPRIPHHFFQGNSAPHNPEGPDPELGQAPTSQNNTYGAYIPI